MTFINGLGRSASLDLRARMDLDGRLALTAVSDD